MNQLSETSTQTTRSMHDVLEKFYPQAVYVLTRRRTTLQLQPTNRHFTYHQWIDRALPVRPNYVGHYMNEAIRHIFPSNSSVTKTQFTHLFRDYLNQDQTIFNYFSTAVVHQMFVQYKSYLKSLVDTAAPVDYETVFQMVVQYLEQPTSMLPQTVLFIPDYEVLLESPQKNRNAIAFVESLIQWYVAHNRPIFTLYRRQLRHYHQGGFTDYETVNHFIQARRRAL